MIGLPDAVTACLFDLDGVLTSTAAVHMRAWKQTFDEFLAEHEPAADPFTERDYTTYVDGRPRLDGVRAFLASRGIELAEGSPDDDVDADTVHGVGNRKNRLLLRLISDGVTPYPGSVRYLDAARGLGLAIGVVTSSANGATVLDAAGLSDYVQARVDGVVIKEKGLRGKPAPDSFLACAAELDVRPSGTAVFEDAQAGVRAGRDGGFGYVVGVNRAEGDGHADQEKALRDQGADIVVNDLADLLEEGA
ncbi:beta-phosphoglucomutase family hydrolase [Saccharomonospora azurea]|uniref:Beta-phosphoglucomutase n=1 Tax=Saccharomonospora azurea NA-128 TaxID=882081 RepID=H8G7W0_9PSEU|nr:beta-phosphoglucomutase family hydrolase [Saccharomonospora azurea]EHY88357.1 haloacid dehalogenase superfamily protein [Saccharomonospora azurea NA-128]